MTRLIAMVAAVLLLGSWSVSARGLITVPTAAGISVTVSPAFAPKVQSFVAALVARGYRPHSIHCAASHGHVRNSRHYSGNACDIDQTGWGRTRAPMYHVAGLAHSLGIRDGCSFRDCGHIDDGGSVGHRHHYQIDQGTMIASRHERIRVAVRHVRHQRRVMIAQASYWGGEQSWQASWQQPYYQQAEGGRRHRHRLAAAPLQQNEFRSYAPL